jgi:hypothetical protein
LNDADGFLFSQEEAQREAIAQDEEKAMREYRAQLDADRQKALSKGTNHAHLRGSVKEGKVRNGLAPLD